MKGYDIFFEKPGEVEKHDCQICGTTCLIIQNHLGPTSWAGAMANKNIAHDYFYCPNLDKDWHKQAEDLVQAIENTPSKRIAKLMQMDLDDLLKSTNND